MNLEQRLRRALALPLADANFAARVRARIAAASWPASAPVPARLARLPVLLAGLNLAGAGVLVGLGVYGLMVWLPAEGWWWMGLAAGMAIVGWSLRAVLRRSSP